MLLQPVIFVTDVLLYRSLFELDLMKVNPERGFYRVVVSVGSQQPSEVKLIGTSGAEVSQAEWLRLKNKCSGQLSFLNGIGTTANHNDF
jgi:hypothetical protein